MPPRAVWPRMSSITEASAEPVRLREASAALGKFRRLAEDLQMSGRSLLARADGSANAYARRKERHGSGQPAASFRPEAPAAKGVSAIL